MTTKRVAMYRRKRPERKVPSQASRSRPEHTREKWSVGEVACNSDEHDRNSRIGPILNPHYLPYFRLMYWNHIGK